MEYSIEISETLSRIVDVMEISIMRRGRLDQKTERINK